MADISGNTTGSEVVDGPSSAVDHALLESLFYNEMMLLRPSSPGPSSFLSQHFSEATSSKQLHDDDHGAEGPIDPNYLAEKELLHDFGVSSSPIRPSSTFRHGILSQTVQGAGTGTTTSTATATATATAAPTPAAAPMHQWTYSAPQHSQHPQHSQRANGTQHHTPIAPALPPQHLAIQQHHHVPIYPNPEAPPPTYPPAVTNSNHNSSVPLNALQEPQQPQQQQPPTLSIDTTILPAGQGTQNRVQQQQQLVDQFATLAGRLGIDLPTNVLQSLTKTAAAQNNDLNSRIDPLGAVSDTNNKRHAKNASYVDTSISAIPDDPIDTSAPSTLQELRKTAEAAIASVSKKRNAESDDGATINNNTSKHMKRKKKPRLADCETRLAELRSENELLKRHLENVSNKAHRFDQEKEAAGKRIHALLEQNTEKEEMNTAVREFSEMYSDYGRNRQQELNFHLDQLQRLVNPTNFTKMGLWTLGQNSISPKNNPIAGILQKELDITTQQGRKILDQSAKIKSLCDNLKECLALLAKLKGLCQQKTQIFQDRMDKCMQILTAKQVVALIKWIDDHTELLETVCPGWGTEHIHSSTSSKQPP